MRARVTSFRLQEGKYDEGMEILQSTVIPRLRSQPGCRGVVVVSDRATASGEITALWDSQEDIDALDERGFWESQVAQIIYLIAAVPERKIYDVNVLDVDSGPLASP
jgi:hypothetical protein